MEYSVLLLHINSIRLTVENSDVVLWSVHIAIE